MKAALPLNIAILGAAGRMGQALVRAARVLPDIRVTGALEAPGVPAIGRDAGLVAGIGELGVPITADFRAAIREAAVLVDFSLAPAVAGHLRGALDLPARMVIGATGLSHSDRALLRKAARRLAIVCAPNMSVGVNVLFALVRRAASVLGPDYDVEIVELHHRFKKDAPSGTALRLGDCVAAGRGHTPSAATVFGRQGISGGRPAGQIGIHAVRGGDAVGDHTVYFAAEGERLELTHRAGSRESFALGALRAARWVAGRRPGLYDMQDVLGL